MLPNGPTSLSGPPSAKSVLAESFSERVAEPLVNGFEMANPLGGEFEAALPGGVGRALPVGDGSVGGGALAVAEPHDLGAHLGVAVEPGTGSRHANPWARHLYDQARARGHRHPHAVRIVARAWLHVIWRCWQDHQPYDPARHRALQTLLHEPVTHAEVSAA